MTWVVPSLRLNVANAPWTPLPPETIVPALTSSGGQAVAHDPVQAEWVDESPAWTYRVSPSEPIRTVPRLVLPLLIVSLAVGLAVGLGAGFAVGLGVGVPPPP